MNVKVVHLIPKDGFGGVERAARSVDCSKVSSLEVNIWFMSGKGLSVGNGIECIGENIKFKSLRMYVNALLRLLRHKPDIVISSLWRATIVAMFYVFLMRLLGDRRKFVVFVHNSKFSNFLDRAVNKCAHALANEIWCDSSASYDAMVKGKHKNKAKVLSFMIKENALTLSGKKDVFLYWGRFAKQKRIDRALDIFNEIWKARPSAIFYLYGPKDNAYADVCDKMKSLECADAVKYMGVKPPGVYPIPVGEGRYFFNTSDREGMAIAVVEAMQLGLVPIVTAVGEVGSYCQDGENSIYVTNDVMETVNRIIKVVNDECLYLRLRDGAMTYWSKENCYEDDFIVGCCRLAGC